MNDFLIFTLNYYKQKVVVSITSAFCARSKICTYVSLQVVLVFFLSFNVAETGGRYPFSSSITTTAAAAAGDLR